MTDAPDLNDDGDAPGGPAPKRARRKGSIGQSIGGVLFGFEQQVFRNLPPPHELVHQARPDAPVPAGDGGFVTIHLPGSGPTEGAPAAPVEFDGIDVAHRDEDPDRGPGPDRPG